MATRKKRKKKNNIKNYYNFSEEDLEKLFKKTKYKATVEWEDDKSDVRKTKEWLELKCYVYHRQNGLDPFTGSKITKMANLHHINFHDSDYGDFNSDNFILLNTTSHRVLHFLMAAMHKLGPDTVLDFIKEMYRKHEKLNGDIKTWKQAH